MPDTWRLDFDDAARLQEAAAMANKAFYFGFYDPASYQALRDLYRTASLTWIMKPAYETVAYKSWKTTFRHFFKGCGHFFVNLGQGRRRPARSGRPALEKRDTETGQKFQLEHLSAAATGAQAGGAALEDAQSAVQPRSSTEA